MNARKFIHGVVETDFRAINKRMPRVKLYLFSLGVFCCSISDHKMMHLRILALEFSNGRMYMKE